MPGRGNEVRQEGRESWDFEIQNRKEVAKVVSEKGRILGGFRAKFRHVQVRARLSVFDRVWGNMNYYKIVGTDLSRMIQGRIRGGRR